MDEEQIELDKDRKYLEHILTHEIGCRIASQRIIDLLMTWKHTPSELPPINTSKIKYRKIGYTAENRRNERHWQPKYRK